MLFKSFYICSSDFYRIEWAWCQYGNEQFDWHLPGLTGSLGKRMSVVLLHVPDSIFCHLMNHPVGAERLLSPRWQVLRANMFYWVVQCRCATIDKPYRGFFYGWKWWPDINKTDVNWPAKLPFCNINILLNICSLLLYFTILTFYVKVMGPEQVGLSQWRNFPLQWFKWLNSAICGVPGDGGWG